MRDEPATGRVRRLSPRDAARFLAEHDPVIARLVAQAGLPSFPRPTETHFAALVRSVTHQQLAGAAAQAIHGRVVRALGDEITPERLLATPTEDLRAAGLSGNKVRSVQDLATKVLDGTVVLEPRGLAGGATRKSSHASPPSGASENGRRRSS